MYRWIDFWVSCQGRLLHGFWKYTNQRTLCLEFGAQLCVAVVIVSVQVTFSHRFYVLFVRWITIHIKCVSYCFCRITFKCYLHVLWGYAWLSAKLILEFWQFYYDSLNGTLCNIPKLYRSLWFSSEFWNFTGCLNIMSSVVRGEIMFDKLLKIFKVWTIRLYHLSSILLVSQYTWGMCLAPFDLFSIILYAFRDNWFSIGFLRMFIFNS